MRSAHRLRLVHRPRPAAIRMPQVRLSPRGARQRRTRLAIEGGPKRSTFGGGTGFEAGQLMRGAGRADPVRRVVQLCPWLEAIAARGVSD